MEINVAVRTAAVIYGDTVFEGDGAGVAASISQIQHCDSFPSRFQPV